MRGERILYKIERRKELSCEIAMKIKHDCDLNQEGKRDM
jgi:hypothetical protein